jgi:hypothetical protein
MSEKNSQMAYEIKVNKELRGDNKQSIAVQDKVSHPYIFQPNSNKVNFQTSNM